MRLSKEEEKILEFVSRKLAAGKRIHELEMLNRLLVYPPWDFADPQQEFPGQLRDYHG